MSLEQLTRRRANIAQTRISPTRSAPAGQPPEIQAWVERAKALPEVRWEKIRAVRTALADGSYDTETHLDTLLGRLPAALGNRDKST